MADGHKMSSTTHLLSRMTFMAYCGVMVSAPSGSPDPVKQGNVIIGERVHTLMWRSGRTQVQLAAVLNVDQGSISNRLRGKTNWSAVEVCAVARWLQVPVAEIMPEVELDDPPEPGGGGYRVVGLPPHIQPPGWIDAGQAA